MNFYKHENVENMRNKTEKMMINLYLDAKVFLLRSIHDIIQEHLSRMDRYFMSQLEIVDLVGIVKKCIIDKSIYRYTYEDYNFLPVFFKFMQEDGTAFPNIARMASLGIEKSLFQCIYDEFPDFTFVDVTPESFKHSTFYLRLEFEKEKRQKLTHDYDIVRYGSETLKTPFLPVSPPY